MQGKPPPRRITQITEYLVRLYMDNSSSSMPPPVIIRGQSGTGRSWVLNLIKHGLNERERGLNNPYVINVPIQLSAKNLVKNIIEEITSISPNLSVGNNKQGRKSPRQKIVLLIDNIDHLLNLEKGDQLPLSPEKIVQLGSDKFKRAKGSGAAKFHHILDVSEFRSFLIENSSWITVIASSGEDISFMEDPDQPFFQFFNLIDLKPFNPDEIREFIKERLRSSVKSSLRSHNDALTLLDSTNYDWPNVLTEGRITYAKFVIDAIKETGDEFSNKPVKDEDLLNRGILLFLSKIHPYTDSILNNLSYTEKKLLDIAIFLPDGFYANQLNGFEGNISQTLKTLKKKEIISSDKEGHNARYKFVSSVFKTYLRYYKNGILRDVLTPTKPLIIRKQ